jgi:hypothetical protein
MGESGGNGGNVRAAIISVALFCAGAVCDAGDARLLHIGIQNPDMQQSLTRDSLMGALA